MATTSIVRRITAASIVLVLSGLGFAIAVSLWFVYNASTEQLERRATEQLSVLSGALTQPLWSFNDTAIRTICDAYSAHEDVGYVKVVGPNSDEPIFEKRKTTTSDLSYKTNPILYQDQLIGSVEIGISRQGFEERLNSILWLGLGSALLISAFMLLGIRHLVTVYLKTPLATLSQWAGKVAKGEYETMQGEVPEVELRPLAAKFREMAGDLAAREIELRKLSMATEQSPASVMITDPQGNIEYVNRTFERVTGYGATEVLGRSATLVKSSDSTDGAHGEARKAMSEGRPWQGDLVNHTRDGREIWERTSIAPLKSAAGDIRHFIAVMEDITREKQQEQRILHQAHYDDLTGLPNRFLSIDRLSQLIKESRRRGSTLAVLFIDLDDFKKVNDSLGHEAGDRLLIQAARRLLGTIREGDTVGRLGGDEFIVLAGDLAEPGDASPLAEVLLEQLRRPFLLDGRELVLTASLGIACFPQDSASAPELLRNADTAMYHSKAEGRNAYQYFTDAMNRSVSRRLKLEQQLHGALQRGEFEVVFQPIIDVRQRTCVGAEALLRWRNAELGEVSPVEFIPICEQMGLIVPIGDYVLREALALVAAGQAGCSAAFAISVNLSPRQFREPKLVSAVSHALQQANVAPRSLILEVTEGVLMGGQGLVDEAISRLAGLGVTIALDDFGTGYASLSYLRRYPFSRLKIDRSFIADLTADAADRELVNAAVQMARALGLTVVAEGVETEQQLAVLAEQGCQYAQGYLFSRPLSRDAVATYLAGPVEVGSPQRGASSHPLTTPPRSASSREDKR
jgi:diguanylate cyclase (GGDEF)-like protein/PAS domain S-box-containing protein